MTEEACALLGGTFSGPGIDCDTAACETYGACCFSDLVCELLPIDLCEQQGGTPQGSCTTCEPGLCPVLGACCFVDGSCLSETHEACGLAGGTYMGYGSDCDGQSCLGACSFSSGLCRDGDSRLSCESLGGLFQGFATDCRGVTDPAVVETGTFSFSQNGRRNIRFSSFDTLDGARQLVRVEISVSAAVLAAVKLTNLGESPIDTDAEVNETISVSSSVFGAQTLVPVDVHQLVIDCGSGFLLEPGATCDYGGLLTLFGAATFTADEDEALEAFLDPEGIDLWVTGAGAIAYDGQKVVFVVFPHRVEGLVRVRYEFVPLGACCLPDETCLDAVDEEGCLTERLGQWVGAGSSCLTGCPCPADFDDDGMVGFLDLVAVLSRWGPCDPCSQDLDQDGVVGLGDLLQLLSAWGPCLR